MLLNILYQIYGTYAIEKEKHLIKTRNTKNEACLKVVLKDELRFCYAISRRKFFVFRMQKMMDR